MESLIINHPFVDGNKRTGFLAMIAFVQEDGFAFHAQQDEACAFTIDISTGTKRFEEIVDWLKTNSKPI